MRGNAPTYQFYAKQYNTLQALGAAALACNAIFIPEGFENIQFLIKSFPLPIQTNFDPGKAEYAMGLQVPRNSVPKVNFDGSVTMIETDSRMIYDFFKQIQKTQGVVHSAKIISGMSDGQSAGTFVHKIQNVHFTAENGGEIDGSSREQILELQANVSYMYFGDEAELGNVGVFNGALNGVVSAFNAGTSGSAALSNIVTAAANAFGNSVANATLSASGFGGGRFGFGG